MSSGARRELLAQVAARYQQAPHPQKTRILDEFVAATGYARKYALRLLAQPPEPATPVRRPRAPTYGPAVQEALAHCWLAANGICSKRLVPFLPELVAALERHGHLTLTDETRAALLALCPATADRLLQPRRQGGPPGGPGGATPAPRLKQQVAVRTFADWQERGPGFVEADLVCHGGSSSAGAFLCTLVLTDVATGWTECLPLLYRGEDPVREALIRLRARLPFPLLGLDTDNGTEFLNEGLVAYCAREQITFTRSRPYRKNDQCFVEQKNGVVVRQLVGYARYVGPVACAQLGELYRAVRLYVNFFQPSLQLREKQRHGAKVSRWYDRAQTPAQRLAATGVLPAAGSAWLAQMQQTLDPVGLREEMVRLQARLAQLAVRATEPDPAPSQSPRRPPPERFGRQAAGLPTGETAASFLGEWLGQRAGAGPLRCQQGDAPPVRRTYRPGPDAFADVTTELRAWLGADPERTAPSLLRELQARYPGQFSERQVRTLERRVKAWRAESLGADPGEHALVGAGAGGED
jgi:hypothetical protein